jgi:putative transposase
MPDSETLSHTTWDCKYHGVFIPKYRRKALYHELRRHLGAVFRALAEQKECRIEEGHLMGDHVHIAPCGRTHRGDRPGPSPRPRIIAN